MEPRYHHTWRPHKPVNASPEQKNLGWKMVNAASVAVAAIVTQRLLTWPGAWCATSPHPADRRTVKLRGCRPHLGHLHGRGHRRLPSGGRAPVRQGVGGRRARAAPRRALLGPRASVRPAVPFGPSPPSPNVPASFSHARVRRTGAGTLQRQAVVGVLVVVSAPYASGPTPVRLTGSRRVPLAQNTGTGPRR